MAKRSSRKRAQRNSKNRLQDCIPERKNRSFQAQMVCYLPKGGGEKGLQDKVLCHFRMLGI